MTIYSDRFIPLRAGNENNPFDINPHQTWLNPAQLAYNTALSHALFDTDISKQRVLALRVLSTPSSRLYFSSSQPKIPNLHWLSKKPRSIKLLDSTGEDASESFRVGADSNGNIFLLSSNAAYTMNLNNESIVKTIEGSYTAFAAIPNRCFSALSTQGGNVVLNENQTFTNVRTVYKGTNKITCMRAQTENLLFVATKEGILTLVDFRQRNPSYSYDVNIKPITGMSINSTTLALAAEEGTVVLQDLRKEGYYRNFDNNTVTNGRTVSFSPTHPNLLAAAENNTVKIWNVINTPISTETITMDFDISTLSWYSERKGFKITQLYLLGDGVSDASAMTDLSYFTSKPDEATWIKTDSLQLSNHVYFHTAYGRNRDIYLTKENIHVIEDALITKPKRAPLTPSKLNTMGATR